jgi:hypothetical protein
VVLTGGPATEEFIRRNPVVSRTIEIRGDQTLEHLHEAIYDAFDRDDEHLYEFQIGGKRPHDRHATSYGGSPLYTGLGDEEDGRISAAKTRIASLALKLRNRFHYWFDFGDDWWHQVIVVAIADGVPKGKFPRVTERVGDSPPQYPEYED